MEAVRVKLLGVREFRKNCEDYLEEGRMEGVVTHWVPEQLAGIIATVLGEVRSSGSLDKSVLSRCSSVGQTSGLGALFPR